MRNIIDCVRGHCLGPHNSRIPNQGTDSLTQVKCYDISKINAEYRLAV